MSLTTNLVLAQQYITRYALPTFLAIGTVGNLLAIVLCFQKQHRKNSCSIYLATISIFGMICAFLGIAPLVSALSGYDVVNSSLIFCRVRGYILQAGTMCFRYTLVLVCVDRYALCNSRATIRALCRPQIAYRAIVILTLFWIITSIHLPVFQTIENGRCSVFGSYSQVFSFYVLVLSAILPIFCMTLLGILLFKNLGHIRSRVQPLPDARKPNGRDIKLIRIVLAEVLVYVLLTFTHPLMLIYTSVTNGMGIQKSVEQRQIESFMSFITLTVLLYLNYNTPFYVHFFASRSYRKEIKQIIVKYYNKCRGIKVNEVTTGLRLQM